eukprot:3295025-Alexandrium_andersonii.AAC.1
MFSLPGHAPKAPTAAGPVDPGGLREGDIPIVTRAGRCTGARKAGCAYPQQRARRPRYGRGR